ncbi:MAG: hypothetical protein Q8R96_08340 [Bacteroidota bacterium]|nr:hypothetical protein [Bacteroidota bacterium]
MIHEGLKANDPTENKDYLVELTIQLEELSGQDVNIPFHIKDIKDNGFVIKIHGLYAFISFDYMPWNYDDTNSWKAVLKSIREKQFYGRIYKFIKDPIFIIVNGDVPQFKPLVLVEGEEYHGIIIRKNKSGVIFDIGDHFHWKCGSVLGFLPKSHFLSKIDFSNINIGDHIQAYYFGSDENDRRLFYKNKKKMDWYIDFQNKQKI